MSSLKNAKRVGPVEEEKPGYFVARYLLPVEISYKPEHNLYVLEDPERSRIAKYSPSEVPDAIRADFETELTGNSGTVAAKRRAMQG